MTNPQAPGSPQAGNPSDTGNQGSANPQAGNGAGNAGSPQAGNPESGTPTPPQDLSHADALEALRKERLANADARTKLKRLDELEKAETARQAATLSETQRAAKERDDATAALAVARTRIGASELKVAAQAAGIIDPDIAAAMLSAKVTYDGTSGEPTNVSDLVKQLKTDKPHLFAAAQGQQQTPPNARASASTGATNPGASAAGAAGTFTKEQINRMSDADYEKNRAAIWEAMQKGQLK